MIRNIIREGTNVDGNWISDILTALCCYPCAIVQEILHAERNGGMNTPLGTADWEKSLCGCFDDCQSCAYAFLCTQCAAASARTEFDQSNWCLNCLCSHPVLARNIIREGYQIEGNCLGDIVCGTLLPFCVTSQLLREVRSKGSVSQKMT